MSYFDDERFKHVAKDPKYKNVPKKDHKIKIDRRFQGMFTDPKFKLDYSVDQRGRPIKHSQAEDYKKYYDLSESSDNESEELSPGENEDSRGDVISCTASTAKDLKHIEEDLNDNKLSSLQLDRTKLSGKIVDRLQDLSVDYARGEGILDTDSSSSDEVTTDDSEEEIEHDWGELDKDADVIDNVTPRLALCHLDWDRVTATDIFVLLNSFLPPTGFIESVTIYPSEFGMQRMKEEEIKGPQELTSQKIQDDDDELDENDEYHREKLRQYQIKRLKYYYAVAVFNNAESANKVYTECDKVEYESSATRLDLRFIPDDMTFDQDPKEVCTKMPENAKYKPRLFANTALQQEKVELTWDETDPDRVELTRKISLGANISEADLKAYIATSSEESDTDPPGSQDDNSDNDDIISNKNSKEDEVAKYRSLLAGIHKADEEKKQGKVDMEISWDLALENRTEEIEEKRNSKSSTSKKTKEKHKTRRDKESDSDNLLSDDGLPSDVDMNDPFFTEEINKTNKLNKKGKRNKKCLLQNDGDEEEIRRKAELELLLADHEEEDSGRRHFNMKAILDREGKKGKKKLKNNKHAGQEEDDFKINLEDDRFSALFTSHLYNIDPADSHFKKTKAMDDIVKEKSKRRKLNHPNDYLCDEKKRKDGLQLSSEITKLVTSIQKKSKLSKQDNHNR